MAEEKKKGFFGRLAAGLAKTRDSIFGGIFTSYAELDDDFYEELEEMLIMADMGMETSETVIAELKDKVKERRVHDPEKCRELLAEVISDQMLKLTDPYAFEHEKSVVFVIGVNGVGKTTTIGKLAARYTAEGKRVLLSAADTFRAAAAEQLTVWAERAGCEIVRHEEGSDPAAVVFDSIAAAKARGADLIIIDTAGRLHNKANLMNELAKIRRIITREMPEADVETLLVLDATTGQNGLFQAKSFQESADITGVVLTKLDGTAKGGIVFAISEELGVPVKFIGVGEQQDDLMPFNPEQFAEALLK
ncbi:MAG: signal recognition particle-docking protein FtsY [Oscillospiraceae bacterium]|nr:signal recognition particle-docking protein FtsY [Oscillospiraceae bacterium]